MALPEDSRLDAEQGGLVLSGDGRSLAVLTRLAGGTGGSCRPDGVCQAPLPEPGLPLPSPQLSVQRIDVSDPAAARSGTRVVLDGQLLATRRLGDQLVVVSLHQPRLAWEALPMNASVAEREAALAALKVEELLPQVSVDDDTAGAITVGMSNDAADVVFAGRARLRGVFIVHSATAGVLSFRETSINGTARFTVATIGATNTDRAIVIPDEGILFESGIFLPYTAGTTVFSSFTAMYT